MLQKHHECRLAVAELLDALTPAVSAGLDVGQQTFCSETASAQWQGPNTDVDNVAIQSVAVKLRSLEKAAQEYVARRRVAWQGRWWP